MQIKWKESKIFIHKYLNVCVYVHASNSIIYYFSKLEKSANILTICIRKVG